MRRNSCIEEQSLACGNVAHITAAFAKVKAHFVFGNVEAMAQLLRWGHLLGVWGWAAAGFFFPGGGAGKKT